MEGSRLSVAFLSPAWPLGASANGIVSYVDTIGEALRRQGHNPCVLARDMHEDNPPPDVFRAEARRSNFVRIYDRLFRFVDPLDAMRHGFARGIVHAARLAIASRAVQLLEMEETFGLIQLVKPRVPIPIIARLHGPCFVVGATSGLPQNSAFYRRVRNEGRGIFTADAVSAPSRDILERTRNYYRLPLAEAVVIPNPGPVVPDAERWSLETCDHSRLLFVGRFDRTKGGDIAIDAFRIVAQRFPQVRLWFVGPDNGFNDERQRRWTIREYIAERAPEVAHRIDWLDRQPNSALPELRRRALVTIIASRYETFSMVALEAAAYGSPIVATKVGGVAEIVSDGLNGILARPEDPDGLAAAISSLLANPVYAAKLGHQAAVDAVRRYHPDTIALQTVAFYRSVLDKVKNRTVGTPAKPSNV